MSTFNKLLKKDQHYLVLMVLLAIFIIFDIEIPSTIAEIVNTVAGKVIVVVIALSFCATKQPILSALALVAAYELIKYARTNCKFNKLLTNFRTNFHIQQHCFATVLHCRWISTGAR